MKSSWRLGNFFILCMSKEMENFSESNESERPTRTSFDAQGAFEQQPFPAYRMPETYTINGSEVSVDQLRRLEIPDLTSDAEIAQFSSEDKEALGETLSIIAETAHIAQALEAPLRARKQAVVDAFTTNACFGSMAEEQQQITEAREAVATLGGAGSSVVNWVNTKGKKLIGALTFAAAVGAIPQAAQAGGFFHQTGTPNMQRTFNSVERGVDVQRQIQDISRRQQDLSIDIERINREEAILAERAAGNRGVAGIENRAENNARIIQIEADYKAKKARMRAHRAELKANFMSKSNPTPAETARYEAQQAQIEAQEIRIEGNYEASRAREDGRNAVRGGQIGNDALNVKADIQRLETEKQRRQVEIQRLEQEKANVLIQGGIRAIRQ